MGVERGHGGVRSRRLLRTDDLVAGTPEESGCLGKSRRFGRMGGIERPDESAVAKVRGPVDTERLGSMSEPAHIFLRSRRQSAEDANACLRHHPPGRHPGRQRELSVPLLHIWHVAELELPPPVGRHDPLLRNRERDPAARCLALDSERAQLTERDQWLSRVSRIEAGLDRHCSRAAPDCAPALDPPAPISSLPRGRRRASQTTAGRSSPARRDPFPSERLKGWSGVRWSGAYSVTALRRVSLSRSPPGVTKAATSATA